MTYIVEIDTPEPLRAMYGDHGYYVHSRRGAVRSPARTPDAANVEHFTRDDADGAVAWLAACGLTARVIEAP